MIHRLHYGCGRDGPAFPAGVRDLTSTAWREQEAAVPLFGENPGLGVGSRSGTPEGAGAEPSHSRDACGPPRRAQVPTRVASLVA